MPQQKRNPLLQYAALTTQLFVGLLIAVWLGKKLDEMLAFSHPVLIWLIPLAGIIGFIIKLTIDILRKK